MNKEQKRKLGKAVLIGLFFGAGLTFLVGPLGVILAGLIAWYTVYKRKESTGKQIKSYTVLLGLLMLAVAGVTGFMLGGPLGAAIGLIVAVIAWRRAMSGKKWHNI